MGLHRSAQENSGPVFVKSVASDLCGPSPSYSAPSLEYHHKSASISQSSSNSSRLTECNLGFKLLRKSGWKEGTGLGAAEQGRLNPVETVFKSDRRGVGAEKKRKFVEEISSSENSSSCSVPRKENNNGTLSRREKKAIAKEKKVIAQQQDFEEKEFVRCFFREFWPDNV